jgi:hypothetical protein
MTAGEPTGERDEAPKATPQPLPNGVVPHPADVVFRFDFMQPAGVHPGFIRIRAADGNIETLGFDVTSPEAWTQIEKINPAIVKLCRLVFELERRITHARREIANMQEASVRATEVLTGRRPATL